MLIRNLDRLNGVIILCFLSGAHGATQVRLSKQVLLPVPIQSIDAAPFVKIAVGLRDVNPAAFYDKLGVCAFDVPARPDHLLRLARFGMLDSKQLARSAYWLEYLYCRYLWSFLCLSTKLPVCLQIASKSKGSFGKLDMIGLSDETDLDF